MGNSSGIVNVKAEVIYEKLIRAFGPPIQRTVDWSGLAKQLIQVEPLPKGASPVYGAPDHPCPQCGEETREVQLFTSVSRVCPLCDG